MTEVENPGAGRDAEKLARAVQTTVRERGGSVAHKLDDAGGGFGESDRQRDASFAHA